MDLSAIALQGLEQAQGQLEQAATRIASVGATSLDGASLDTVDLSAGMVALMTARADFSANLATLKAADQVSKSVIDLIA